MFFKLLLGNTLSQLRSSNVSYIRIGNKMRYAQLQRQQVLHIKTYDKEIILSEENINNLPKIQNVKVNEKVSLNMSPSVPLTTALEDKNFAQAALTHTQQGNCDNDDPDTFGNGIIKFEDEGDKIEEEYISRSTRRNKKLRTIQYARLIKDHLNNHRIKEAIDVLEVKMLQEDRVKPDQYIYRILLSGCAKAGYTRKCFQLFTKMLQRGIKPKEATFTSLFNACANAPSKEEGLTRANKLRIAMLNRGQEPNLKIYNAMIKLYGRCGDVKTAYTIADEMREKNIPFTAETYNFLFQACASDKENGFRHCLLTWHKMLSNGIHPDYYSFNAILRCTRDCNFGNLESMKDVLQRILNENNNSKMYIANTKSEITDGNTVGLLIEANSNPFRSEKNASYEEIKCTTRENRVPIQMQPLQTITKERLEFPNLLLAQPHLGSVVKLEEIQKPHERFLLLGGLDGFLQLMKSYSITPDIEIFTAMLEVIPPTNSAEKQLLTYIRKIGLKSDIDFFNILIKKRAMRFDYEGGKEVLTMIKTAGLNPDIVTYGVLALGCTTVESSRELLDVMDQCGVRMNIEILGAMLRQGCSQNSFDYVCEIMQISLDENIMPNGIFLKHLHDFYIKCARAIDSRHSWSKTKHFKKYHMKFCDKFRLYQEEHNILGLKLDDAIKILKQRKSSQSYEDHVQHSEEPLKNEKFARKQKLRKYIKKIKINTLKGDEIVN